MSAVALQETPSSIWMSTFNRYNTRVVWASLAGEAAIVGGTALALAYGGARVPAPFKERRNLTILTSALVLPALYGLQRGLSAAWNWWRGGEEDGVEREEFSFMDTIQRYNTAAVWTFLATEVALVGATALALVYGGRRVPAPLAERRILTLLTSALILPALYGLYSVVSGRRAHVHFDSSLERVEGRDSPTPGTGGGARARRGSPSSASRRRCDLWTGHKTTLVAFSAAAAFGLYYAGFGNRFGAHSTIQRGAAALLGGTASSALLAGIDKVVTNF